MRYFFRVEYDGAAYAGWQRQDNAITIQQKLEEAFAMIARCSCAVTGAGRTDAGVHARRQGAHLQTDGRLDIARVQHGVDAVLPHDIHIYDLRAVPDDFNARYAASGRVYKYRMSTVKTPLHRGRVWQMYFPVDWNAARTAAAQVLGTHDFAAFCASGSDTPSTMCTVRRSELEQDGACWTYTIEADRFVYRMVRSLMGTIIGIGRGAIAGSMSAIIQARERSRVGETAPACGLVLDDVFYPEVTT